jgi:signal transduction histidine kinase
MIAASSYVSSIWPAAGLALACILKFGRVGTIGILLGTLLFNARFLVLGSPVELDAFFWLHAFIAAIGTVSQGAVGAQLIKLSFNPPYLLKSFKEAYHIFLLGGPIACIIGASISSYSIGYITVGSDIFSVQDWFIWWTGDSIGVMLFAPLILLLLSGQNISAKRKAQVILPVISLLALVFYLHIFNLNSQRETLTKEYETRAESIISDLQYTINTTFNATHVLRAFFENSDNVTRQEFDHFSSKLLQQTPVLKAVEWVPKVTGEMRTEFEKQARLDGYPLFEFTHKENGKMVVTPEKDLYFPVYFIKPYINNPEVLGYDVSSDQERAKSLQRAMTSKNGVLSAPIKLIQANDSFGYLYILPVFTKDKRNDIFGFTQIPLSMDMLKGYVISVVYMPTLVKSILNQLQTAQFSLVIEDVSNPTAVTVYNNRAEQSQLISQHNVIKGSKRWKVSVYVEESALYADRDWQSWSVLTSSLLFITLLSFFIIVTTAYYNEIELAHLRSLQSLRSATSRASEAQEAKGQFLANLSHEIRTPLNSILGKQYLAKQGKDIDSVKHHIEESEKALEQILKVTNDILDFSKLETGSLEIESYVFNLNHLVQLVESVTQREFEQRKLAFRSLCSFPKDRYVMGDENRLQQVLTTLLRCSMVSTTTGSISLVIHEKMVSENTVTIEFDVEDSSGGLSEEDMAYIFKPFLNNTLNTSDADIEKNRARLGMSICQQLIELMGGEIFIDNIQGQGFRSSFTLELRRPEDLNANVDLGGLKPANNALENLNVLIVEDDDLNQKVLQSLLETKGMKCQVANNGLEALEIMLKHKFDLILMDIQMPEMDGLECTKKIKRHSEWRDIPIIALTANAMRKDIDASIEAGMQDHLVKPVEPEKLFETISKYIKH